MTSVQLKDLKGKGVGEVALEDSVFGIEPNVHVLHLALHRQLSNWRAGTASTKTRSEVRGGGRKPWRQKGTGRARAGSIRSPLWNGGGVIFGPKPRDYSLSMPKKARQLALRSALAARRDQFVVLKNFDGLFKNPPAEGHTGEIEQPKTKQFAAALKDLGLSDKCVLLMLDPGVPGVKQIERAARNLCNVCVCSTANLNVKQLMECEVVLTSERTVVLLNHRFQPQAATAGGAGAAANPQRAARAKKAAAPDGESAEKKAGKTTAKKASTEKAADKPKSAKAEKLAAEKSSKTSKKSEQ
jgi:large subunit ribosomal protein L4